MTLVDEFARKVAVERFGLPLCLHLPIAARDEADIRTFIGDITDIVVPGTPNKALLVHAVPQNEIDFRLPVQRTRTISTPR